MTSKLFFGVAAAALLGTVHFASAQNAAPATENAPPSAFKGFAGNRKDPVKIEANSLEVRDKEKAAVFIGNVVVTQGETVIRCKELTVYYEGNALGLDRKDNPPATKKQQKDASAQRIKRLVAVGGVIVTSKDQKATGDRGVFEMATNMVTLTGNVIITQGQNVMRGEKLVVDLNTNKSRLDGTQRVQGLFIPNSDKDKKRAAEQKNRPAKKQRQPAN